jgi:hypothetical protein
LREILLYDETSLLGKHTTFLIELGLVSFALCFAKSEFVQGFSLDSFFSFGTELGTFSLSL